jgi:hypothetical protein
MLLIILVGFGSSNLDQDRAECADQLVGLATCLPYVGGQAKAPTLDCCTGLKQVLQKSRKCLCILIKDRDDPNLGLQINATLALGLPSACHAPLNTTECVCKYTFFISLSLSIYIYMFTAIFSPTHQLIGFNIGVMDSALLHLAPNSTDAKVFEGFSNSTKGTSATPVASGNKFLSCLLGFFFFFFFFVKKMGL